MNDSRFKQNTLWSFQLSVVFTFYKYSRKPCEVSFTAVSNVDFTHSVLYYRINYSTNKILNVWHHFNTWMVLIRWILKVGSNFQRVLRTIIKLMYPTIKIYPKLSVLLSYIYKRRLSENFSLRVGIPITSIFYLL